MTVNFNTPAVGTTTSAFQNIGMDLSKPPTISAAKAVEPDTVDIKKPEEKKEKKGPIRAIKDFIGSMKKFGNTISGYTKGTIKGAFQGFLVGSGIYTVSKIVSSFNLKAGKKALPAKALGIISAGLTLIATYWNTSLNVNQQNADVDHRWQRTPIVNK